MNASCFVRQRTRLGLARVLSLLFLLMAGLSLSATTAYAAILTVSNIEVTQAIQTTTNTIPLVTQRSTAVRATIAVTGSLINVSGVSGRLHVFISGVEITPIAGILPINAPFTAKLAPLRTNQNDTLNFELPAPTGITASTHVTFRVNLTHATATTVPLTTSDLTFTDRVTPYLFYTRLNYIPSGLGLPALSDVQGGTGDAFVRGIFPVDDSDPLLYRPGFFPTLTWTEDLNANNVIDGTEVDHILSFLESCRHYMVTHGAGSNDRVFLYGWVNGNPITGNGWSTVGGRVGFGNTDHVRYQRSYAHELTHNFGFNHNSLHIDEVGWDVGGRLISNPASNNTMTRIKVDTVANPIFDIMVPAHLTNEAWVHTGKYTDYFNIVTLASPDKAGEFVKFSLNVQGILDPSGRKLVQLLPVFRYPWPSQNTAVTQEKRPFTAQILLGDGSVRKIPFSATIANDGDEMRNGFFSLTIPYEGQVDSLEILNSQGQSLGAIKRQEVLPAVQVTIPEPGQRLGAQTRVRWNFKNPNPNNPLMFEAAFSSDGGDSWVPIAVQVTDNLFSFDSSALLPAVQKGVLRVYASDGLNTVSDEVTGLTTPAWVLGNIQLQECVDMTMDPITFEFTGLNGNSFKQRINLEADGSFILKGIPHDSYIVAVKGSKWLRKLFKVNVSETGFGQLIGLLFAGDVNGDNVVGLDDLGLLSDAFDTKPGDPLFNPNADLNCDGVVGLDDLGLLALNFDTIGE